MPGMLRNKAIGVVLALLVGYYIATDPVGAGRTGKAVLHGAKALASGLFTFLSALSH